MVVSISNNKESYTLDEANNMISIIYRFTHEAQAETNLIITMLETTGYDNKERSLKLERRVEYIIDKWNAKVKKLGAKPKGLWMANIEFKTGYYSWKYPEKQIQYWHEKNAGFPSRTKLS